MGRSAAATAASEVHGFPAALTSFVGRAGAVREVAGLLDQAGEVARQVAGRFADGAWLVELAAARDPAQVAAALGVREQPGVPLVSGCAGPAAAAAGAG